MLETSREKRLGLYLRAFYVRIALGSSLGAEKMVLVAVGFNAKVQT
jgi:hypothetical protein